jgi:hypothetical protein
MSTHTLSRLAGGLAVACLATCAIAATPLAATLEGRWRSEGPEPLPGQDGDTNYLVREFEFAGNRWRIDFVLYDDAELQRPLLSGRNEGRYVLGSASDGKAAPAEFFFDHRTLTARAEPIAAALSSAGCGDGKWVVNQSQSVFERGCRAFRVFSRAECDREYDRVVIVKDRLFLGARPADGFMCAPDRRPAGVGQAALMRAR